MPYKLTPSEEKQERMFGRMRIVLAVIAIPLFLLWLFAQ
jgi:hypothetical protein